MSAEIGPFRRRWWWTSSRWIREFDAWKAAQPVSAWQRRDDALVDQLGEAHERAHLPCLDCEIGEPHACERAWWQQQIDHHEGRRCSDDECLCHLAADLAAQAASLRPTSILAIRGAR